MHINSRNLDRSHTVGRRRWRKNEAVPGLCWGTSVLGVNAVSHNAIRFGIWRYCGTFLMTRQAIATFAIDYSLGQSHNVLREYLESPCVNGNMDHLFRGVCLCVAGEDHQWQAMAEHLDHISSKHILHQSPFQPTEPTVSQMSTTHLITVTLFF